MSIVRQLVMRRLPHRTSKRAQLGGSIPLVSDWTRPAGAVGGALLGGVAGNLLSRAGTDELEEEYEDHLDSTLAGAVLGAGAGYLMAPIVLAKLKERSDSQSGDQLGKRTHGLKIPLDRSSRQRFAQSLLGRAERGGTLSLDQLLPSGYRQVAQPAARGYRSRMGGEYSQVIEDSALDRQVPVSVGPSPLGSQVRGSLAAYNPNTDRVTVTKTPGQSIEADALPEYLSHELTHASQNHSPEDYILVQTVGGQTAKTAVPDYNVRRGVKRVLDSVALSNPGEKDRYIEYFSNPMEIEAYLSTVKRDYYRETGRVVTSRQEAENALNWEAARSGRNNALVNLLKIAGAKDRDYLLKQLSKYMPALVSNALARKFQGAV